MGFKADWLGVGKTLFGLHRIWLLLALPQGRDRLRFDDVEGFDLKVAWSGSGYGYRHGYYGGPYCHGVYYRGGYGHPGYYHRPRCLDCRR